LYFIPLGIRQVLSLQQAFDRFMPQLVLPNFGPVPHPDFLAAEQ